MEKILSKKIVQWCEKEMELPPARQEVIQFGLEMGLESILKTLGIFVIGVLLRRVPECLAALFLFCSLRMWAGGIHCKTGMGCFLFMFIHNLASVFGAELLQKTGIGALWFLWLFIGVMTALFAPMNPVKNPIEDKGLLRRKKAGACIWVILEACFMLAVNSRRWKWIITLSVLLEVLTFLPVAKNIMRRNSK